jgi:hypothetical protein
MHQPTTSHRSEITHKRTVRSSGGFKSTEGIDGGLIVHMRSQSVTTTVSTELSTWNAVKPLNEAFVRKLRSGSIVGMFLERNEREVSL